MTQVMSSYVFCILSRLKTPEIFGVTLVVPGQQLMILQHLAEDAKGRRALMKAGALATA